MSRSIRSIDAAEGLGGISRQTKSAVCAAAVLLLAASSSAQVDHGTHSVTSSRYSRSEASYVPPDVTLLDARGDRVALREELGHGGPVLLQFIFTTCPAVCPALAGTFAAAQERLAGDLDGLRMISISIDPEHDTPARLSDYARTFAARPQWHFLTGELDAVVAVQQAFDAYRGNKMRHEPLTFLRASPAAPWVRLGGFPSAADLVAEVRKLTAP
jgi:protein SCO1/2